MYTDGVSEAESPAGEQFGTRRIEESALKRAGLAASEIVEGIVDDVLEWAGARGQNDDLTLIVIKSLAEPAR